MEKKKEEGLIQIVDTMYYKDYTVLPESEELTEELTGKGAE